MKKKEIAVLVAAGKGSRMLPLSAEVPKPLIKVHGVPMIETIINSLNLRRVETIYITVGYKREQFSYLTEKFSNVVLVNNPEYVRKNNISSFYAMGDIVGDCNCFICDADLYIQDMDIFKEAELKTSCFFGKYVAGKTQEWAFKTVNNRVTKIGIGGDDDYNLVGISYWLGKDAALLKEKIRQTYREPDHDNLFWEEVAGRYFNELFVTIHPVQENQVVEIDTYNELKTIDCSYKETD